MKSLRDFVSLAATAVCIVAGVAGLFVWSLYEDAGYRPFDAAEWQRATPITRNRTTRSQMVDDLLRRYNFRGWSRQQIVGLLGPASNKASGFEQWSISYVLGLEQGGAFSLDDEALCFALDSNGQVMSYRVCAN